MSEREAAKAIENYFKALNGYDEQGYIHSHHFPHIRVNDRGEVNIVMNSSELLPLGTIRSYLKKREGWHHSSLDSMEVLQASSIKVHFNIQFSRYREDGSRYVGYNAFWVVTQKEDHWGILIRSSYAP